MDQNCVHMFHTCEGGGGIDSAVELQQKLPFFSGFLDPCGFWSIPDAASRGQQETINENIHGLSALLSPIAVIPPLPKCSTSKIGEQG